MEHSFWYHRKIDLEEKYVIVKYAYAAPDHVIMHVNDLTAQKKAEENLKHISIHDALTGLYNRFYSDAEIDRISASRIRPVSFIMIDLNDLKGINDQKGHAAGDLYIINTAALLRQTFRPEDMVARIGGDEFFIMLPLVDEETCSQALKRLRDHLTQFNLKADLPVSLAAGHSTAYIGDSIEKKIAEADRRMYEEKAHMKAAAGKPS
jgi:diguanylate cyclase (GGDEF)-like protein